MGVYIPVPVVGIELEIPDFVFGETVLKRRARLITLTYNLKAKYLTLGWQVGYFEKAANDEYGPPIEAPGIVNYSKESIADNNTMVDVATGAIVVADAEGNYPVDYTGQYDYINNLLETTPVLIHDIIRDLGNQVDWQTA